MFYSEPDALPAPILRPAKRKNTVIVAAIVLLAIFLTLGSGLSLLLSGSKAIVGAKATANRFLSLVEKRNYNEASNQFSGRSEEALITSQDVRDMMAVQKKRRGKAIRHSGPQSSNVSDRNGVTVVRLIYREKFANKSEAPMEFFLKSRDDEWRIESVQFAH